MSQNKNTPSGNRRNRNYHHYNNKHKINIGDKGKEILENIDENNAVIKQFRGYAAELDNKHDRYERIFKYSRDITIESKRIIYLLHTLNKENNKDTILLDAKTRLDNLAKTLFQNIANELNHQDSYQYLRAYSSGLQEYIEAITFYNYLSENKLPDWSDIEKNLTYKTLLNDCDAVNLSDGQNIITTNEEIKTLITPTEYILGVADLTGELMRKCINNLASGDITSCYQTCNLVRDMHIGFIGCVGVCGKEIRRKLYVLKQSLIKMENVCYTVKVRGSEIPKHMLAEVAIGAAEEYPAEEDEGYQAY
ncbi:hypothetical protein PV327_000986 [Microctonus hyperodae]|uniref:Translin-associated protein X n=1 Tax=Microctonus hyperodae TaxID=165561 RepID=A0AA39G963_MICHY|nr:hypothetical protein PV327_000986 [Microctonus hyperodae]